MYRLSTGGAGTRGTATTGATPADHLHPGTPASGRHLAAVLLPSRLCVSGPRGVRQYQLEWSSERRPLETAVLQPRCGVFSGNWWYALVWQARHSRAAGVGCRRVGRRAGHPRRGPRVIGHNLRMIPQYEFGLLNLAMALAATFDGSCPSSLRINGTNLSGG